jgi:hypothetical protein
MPRFTWVLVFAIVAGALASQATAQTCGCNAQSPIATDRPQITSSSIVVPCGNLQFENGFLETGNGGQQSRSLTKNWTVAGMFSVTWPTEGPRRDLTGQSSLYFDRQLTRAWDAYVEYSGSFPQ